MSEPPKFKELHRRWYYATHDKGRIPWCWDCKLLRSARRDDEFYVHDEPRWMFDEAMEQAEPAIIVRPYGTWANGTADAFYFDWPAGIIRRVWTPRMAGMETSVVINTEKGAA